MATKILIHSMVIRYILVSCLFFASCTYKKVPGYLKSQFKYSQNFNNKVDEKLDIYGFYRDQQKLIGLPENQKLNCKWFTISSADTSKKHTLAVLDIMFFKNGLCLVAPLSKLKPELDPEGFKKIKFGTIYIREPGYVYSVSEEYWGPFQIYGDTVKIKVIKRGTLNQSFVGAYEQWYKIIDKNTIQPIYFKALSNDCCPDIQECAKKIDKRFYPASTFYPVTDIFIDPDYSWLINERWFWENKEEYNAWKKKKASKN